MSNVQETHVCPACRLVQRPAKSCRACGSSGVVPLSRVRFELSETVHRVRAGQRRINHAFRGGRGCLIFLVALVATGFGISWLVRLLIAFKLLETYVWVIPAVLVIATYLLGRFFPVLRPIKRLSATTLDTPSAEPGAETLSGSVQLHGRDVAGWLCQERGAAAFLQLYQGGGQKVLLRASSTAEFLCLRDDGSRVLIAGELWLVPPLPSPCGKSANVAEVSEVLGTLEISESVEARAFLLRQGDRLELTARTTREASAALAGGYRDDGLVETLRGTPGCPVLVRWLGAAS